MVPSSTASESSLEGPLRSRIEARKHWLFSWLARDVRLHGSDYQHASGACVVLWSGLNTLLFNIGSSTGRPSISGMKRRLARIGHQYFLFSLAPLISATDPTVQRRGVEQLMIIHAHAIHNDRRKLPSNQV